MSVQESGQVSEFSADEKAAIRAIWKNVYEKFEDAGVAILSRLFVNHPEVRGFFPKFRKLRTVESMRKSPALRWHGERIINALNDAVEELDIPAMQRLRLRQLSQRHATEFNVEPQYFKEMAEIILAYLDETSGKDFTVDVRASWAKFLSLICVELNFAY